MAAQPKTNHMETMSKEIRIIYNSDISNAETLIETYLERRLKEYSDSGRLEFMEELTQQFRSFTPRARNYSTKSET